MNWSWVILTLSPAEVGRMLVREEQLAEMTEYMFLNCVAIWYALLTIFVLTFIYKTIP